LIVFLGAALIAGGIAAFLAMFFARVFSNLISQVDYQKLVIFIIGFITLLTVYFSGVIGFIILSTSTAIGLLAPLCNVKRSHAMGCLLLPVILFFLL